MMLSSKMAMTIADCGVVSLEDSGRSTPATGVMTSLSRRGAFIETLEPFVPGQPIRVEFKIDGRPVSLFANVSRVQEAENDALSSGIDVIFYEVDEITESMIEEAVERLWMRYRP